MSGGALSVGGSKTTGQTYNPEQRELRLTHQLCRLAVRPLGVWTSRAADGGAHGTCSSGRIARTGSVRKVPAAPLCPKRQLKAEKQGPGVAWDCPGHISNHVGMAGFSCAPVRTLRSDSLQPVTRACAEETGTRRTWSLRYAPEQTLPARRSHPAELAKIRCLALSDLSRVHDFMHFVRGAGRHAPMREGGATLGPFPPPSTNSRTLLTPAAPQPPYRCSCSR